MKTFAALLLGIAVLYLSGCALPNAKLVSAEDITETTTRFYPERTADDVREAVREMFYLMDGDQVKVQENESVILGDRRVFIYAVLAITDMTWRYEVYTSEIPSGTAVRVNVSLARNGSVAGGIAPVGKSGYQNSHHQMP